MMASSPSNSPSEPDVIEQVITEFFAKSLHIILESRSPYVSSRNYCPDLFPSSPSPVPSSSSSSSLPRHRWFNLALKDCPAALENFDLWRQSNLEPMVVDVVLVSRGTDDPLSNSERTVERWVVQYESRKIDSILSDRSYSSDIPSMCKKIYRRTMVMLRSLYASVRLLPAYKVFQHLNSSARVYPFSLSHKISSFIEPFTQAEDAEMKFFSFVPVDTHCGKFSLVVSYLPKLEDVSSESFSPVSVQFIPDYVGSPTTDPHRSLHYIPSTGSLPTYVSYTRRHSWSNDHGVVPSSPSPSPSPAYSNSRAMHYTASPGLPPRTHPPVRRKNSFDDYRPLPPFSPSSSPSTPTHLPGVQLQNTLLRAESAPDRIPVPRVEGNSGLPKQGFPPTPFLKSGKAESSLQLKKGSGGLHIGMTLQKMLYSGKEESGILPGPMLSSFSLLPVPSRSSSKVSCLDWFDDSEFTCPFAVDDEELPNLSRVQPSDTDVRTGENLVSGELIPIRRSPDAAVGALIRLLKTAPPLRQDLPNSVISSLNVKGEVNQGMQHNKEEDGVKHNTAPKLFQTKTVADALEELKGYREIREKLVLKQAGSKPLGVHSAEKVDKSSSELW